MNDPRWVKVYTASNPMDAHIIQAMLDEEEFAVMLLDKQDSSYGFGNVDIYVIEEHAPQAIPVIQKFIENLS
ncbi:MAG TPA: hypothetical protein DIS90_05540 [Cytophagales bacterium]|nr:hypothetical protein [Cytophagales bacterium]HRE74532.1 DUF2007 domain-containing protein [Flavobacteriales bacterium]HRE98691.1 DUF2007 domain-containing protein [Flavobacteriales bacterium]HRJ36715.1 DUF2007 domain-containing protein [Flavobacteriales bacterium]HRJ37866.1 DUF2007 domain-containing protein [Flavobacteriales bacterium]